MNILTFDIEEWYIEKIYRGGRREKYKQYDESLDDILCLLDERRYKATFFCLGKLATDFPDVVKRIANAGHEVGCHSHEHIWLSKLTPAQLRSDTYNAISALQDVSGQAVDSYRAPAFSIGESNKWAFEILAEIGVKNDASIFPASRDFGGFVSFPSDRPCVIEYKGICINEFPIPVVKVMGKELIYSGGGYFRMLPLWFVRKQMNGSDYNMCYFHINDIIRHKTPLMSKFEYEKYFRESGSFIKRYARYFKSNVGRSKTMFHIGALLSEFHFMPIKDYLCENKLTNIVRI